MDTDNNAAIAFFRMSADGRRIPAEAPTGNPGGAGYFDAEDYNYDMPFATLNAPVGSVYANRRPQLLRTGWVAEE